MDADTFLEALDDVWLQGLLRADGNRPLSWGELMREPLPTGWSTERTWDALFAVRRLQGIFLPETYPDCETQRFFVITAEFLQALVDVARRSSNYCPVYRRMRQKESYQGVQRALRKEAQAAGELDGLGVSLDDVEQMAMGYKLPRTPSERVMANVGIAVSEVDARAVEPISRRLLCDIYDCLTRDVEEWELDEALGSELFSREMLDGAEFYAYANDESKDPSEPSLVTGLFLRATIQAIRPFPHLNNLMAWLAFRWYALSHGWPVLAIAPVARTVLQWEQGLIPSSAIRFGVSSQGSEAFLPVMIAGRPAVDDTLEWHSDRYPGEGDITRYLMTSMGLLLYGLDQLESDLDESMGELRDLAMLDTTLNYRQNRVVLSARSDHGMELSIAQHQAAHGVAYATARADLMDLVARGYLRQRQRGRKFVYTAGPRVLDAS